MQKIINLTDKIDDEKLKEASKIIKEGGIVVFPTETVYGIGVNAYNEDILIILVGVLFYG